MRLCPVSDLTLRVVRMFHVEHRRLLANAEASEDLVDDLARDFLSGQLAEASRRYPKLPGDQLDRLRPARHRLHREAAQARLRQGGGQPRQHGGCRLAQRGRAPRWRAQMVWALAVAATELASAVALAVAAGLLALVTGLGVAMFAIDAPTSNRIPAPILVAFASLHILGGALGIVLPFTAWAVVVGLTSVILMLPVTVAGLGLRDVDAYFCAADAPGASPAFSVHAALRQMT